MVNGREGGKGDAAEGYVAAVERYNYLYQIYQHRGYLTPDEANYANQLSQMLTGLQAQKMRVDQELSEETMKHLARMMLKR